MKQTPNGCGEWQQVLRVADRYAYTLWEALLIAIYLPEGKEVYIHIRSTLLPEATTFSWGLPS